MTHAAEDRRACQIFLEFGGVILGIIAGMWFYDHGRGWHPFWAALGGIVVAILAGWLLKQVFCRLLGLGRSEAGNAAPAAVPAAPAESGARPAASVAGPEVPAAPAAAESAPEADASGDDGTGEGGHRPANLTEKPEGAPDDLKKIRGVGPKLEKMLNEMGIWHFRQIAEWGPEEVAWVDRNLPAFKGRVSRDNWVEQARVLAAGGATEFSQRVEKGEVYDPDGGKGGS